MNRKTPGYFSLYVPFVSALPVMLALAIALWFLIPTSDVTEAPGSMFHVGELLLPGTSPAWGVLGGPALFAWTYLLTEAFLTWRVLTPYLVTAILVPGIARPFGLGTGPAVYMINNPSWIAVLGPAALMFVVNLFLVRRLRQASASGVA